MVIADILAVLDPRDANHHQIGRELARRAEMLGMIDTTVALSCLHDCSTFVVYKSNSPPQITADSSSAWQDNFVTRPCLKIDLTALDELGLISPSVYVSGRLPLPDQRRDIEAALREFCLAAVRRHRATIRRSFIEAKVGSNDIGTFCYRLLNESLPRVLLAMPSSIFVLDKLAGELRLRGQFPRRKDARYISDISVPRDSDSWVNRTFKSQTPMAEYNPEGKLPAGGTAEDSHTSYHSRVYWPVRLQFRAATANRVKDPVIGVIRVSNATDEEGSTIRPFHCFDAFAIEFIAECLHNIVEAYVDRDVEGFNRDVAFHGAKSPISSCIKNLKLAAQLLFDPNEVTFLHTDKRAVPPQFSLTETGRFTRDELIRAFNNAYAFALNLSAQIERSNITNEFHATRGKQVDNLFSDVIQIAIRLAPCFEISHSLVGHTRVGPHVQISHIFDLPLPPPVVGEIGALTSVFINLIDNSIKYSNRKGDARIDFSWQDREEHICVSIRDNGIGIPLEDAERIFTRHVRSERARQHTVNGDGLGLAYCKRVLEAFGGTIQAVPLDEGLEIQVQLKKA
jgi:hypothetical protein